MSDLPPSNSPLAPGVQTGPTADTAMSASALQGVVLGVASMCIWGLFPLVFKTVAHMSPLEVLAHRSLWALVFAGLVMAVMGRREVFSRGFYTPRHIRMAAVSGSAIAVNWGVFIWAVSHDQVLQSSLGYYINPLVSVLLGVVFLRERLNMAAWTAIALAASGVAVLVWRVGELPWIALSLAVSWALYGLVRKRAPLGSLPGLFLETLVLSPIALLGAVWLVLGGVDPLTGLEGLFAGAWVDTALLIMTGAVTALPLLLFARATRILRLSTIGLLMYIVPTAQFLLAVLVFGEPFTTAHLWAFGLIWMGLVIYSADALRRHR